METITINIKNDKLTDKVTRFLELLKDDGLEIINKEDYEDLKLLRETRVEESIPFEEYLKNEN
ncbi:MAG: hypothetical protein L3J41_14000 [Melioribacteraceae bacterium]|nr:hypothetical protein [Melioribacteraceae bacterium]